MLIENQKNLNKMKLESNWTQTFETETKIKQKSRKVFIKLIKLNVLVGMKHFIHITMMTNLAIHAIVVPLPSGTM